MLEEGTGGNLWADLGAKLMSLRNTPQHTLQGHITYYTLPNDHARGYVYPYYAVEKTSYCYYCIIAKKIL